MPRLLKLKASNSLEAQIHIGTHGYQKWDSRVMGTYSPLRVYQIWQSRVMGTYSPLRVYQIWQSRVMGTYFLLASFIDLVIIRARHYACTGVQWEF